MVPTANYFLQVGGFRLPFLASGGSALLFVVVFAVLLPKAGLNQCKHPSARAVHLMVH